MKIAKIQPQIYQKSIKNPSKFDRNRFGTPVCCRSGNGRTPDLDFDDLLAPLGRFGEPFWVQVAPNGCPRGPKWAPKTVKIDVKIDAKIDAEKVSKIMPTWSKNNAQIVEQLNKQLSFS